MPSRSAAVLVTVFALAAGCGARPVDPPALPVWPDFAHPLVGTRADLSGLRWLTPAAGHDFAAHRLTLLRWWTVHCAFCIDSLPGLETLGRRFGARGLGLVGVFHPKQSRAPTDTEVVTAARALGFGGAIASDDRWLVLESLRSRGGLTAATSITVLVDETGTVRWVHAGPRLHRSQDPAEADAEVSFRQLEQLLAERLR